ncbi:MAG: Transposase family protein [Thermomicrobiales bacterium]|jgi:transposase|nr:Transposase family protein [Thermomicrobiales bacterium]
MEQVTTYVGIDAHKKDLFIALLVGDQATPMTWQVANEPQAVRRLARKIEREAPGPVHVCYEAGPCGYALQRQLATTRVTCQVIAPALIPRIPGERIKTNRRDARKLAELFRAGLLTEVRPPTPEDEAVRDLCRARDDAREDLQRCRHRLSKLLLRRGLHYPGRNWTHPHRRWLASLSWAHEAERVVVDDYVLAIDHVEARLLELDARLTALAHTAPYREPVAWLRCFRGIETLTAMLLLGELHDFRRFHSPRALMAYVGLVPSEHSSGETHRRGRITRAGNALVRRLLVETAWHYQRGPQLGKALSRRRQGQPARAIAIADKAHQRLCRRFRTLRARQMPPAKIVVAVARELVGFVWAALQPPPPSQSVSISAES